MSLVPRKRGSSKNSLVLRARWAVAALMLWACHADRSPPAQLAPVARSPDTGQEPQSAASVTEPAPQAEAPDAGAGDSGRAVGPAPLGPPGAPLPYWSEAVLIAEAMTRLGAPRDAAEVAAALRKPFEHRTGLEQQTRFEYAGMTFGFSARGRLVFFLGAPHLQHPRKRMDKKAAIEWLGAFARAFVPEVMTGEPRAERDGSHLIVTWTQRSTGAQVSVYPNTLSMEMNFRTGGLDSFEASDVDAARTRPPAIDRAEASRRLRAVVGRGVRLQEPNAVERFNPAGGFHTVWEAEAKPPCRPVAKAGQLAPRGTFVVWLDADTGVGSTRDEAAEDARDACTPISNVCLCAPF
jgi:hypothetical protein